MSSAGITDGSPELFPVRNSLYLGDYGSAISKANGINVSNDPDKRIEQDSLVYRAHIGLGQYDLVLNDIKDGKETPVSLRAVRILAQYLKERNATSVFKQLETLMEDPATGNDSTLLVVAATINLHEGNEAEALRLLHNPITLELSALQVRTLLRINRIDLAEQALKRMTELNDEATITKLTTAYVSLAKGGTDMIEEAQVFFQELNEKFENTIVLMNGLALCYMQNNRWAEAEKLLLSALSKNPNDADTLVNLIAVEQHQQTQSANVNNTLSNRKISQLRSLNPNHYWITEVSKMDKEFDELASKYDAHHGDE
jgi:coatomer protein complex subunit epsilon